MTTATATAMLTTATTAATVKCGGGGDDEVDRISILDGLPNLSLARSDSNSDSFVILFALVCGRCFNFLQLQVLSSSIDVHVKVFYVFLC